MSGSRTSHRALTDVALERELDVLSRIYERAIQRYRQKKGGSATAQADAMKGSERDRTDERILPP